MTQKKLLNLIKKIFSSDEDDSKKECLICHHVQADNKECCQECNGYIFEKVEKEIEVVEEN